MNAGGAVGGGSGELTSMDVGGLTVRGGCGLVLGAMMRFRGGGDLAMTCLGGASSRCTASPCVTMEANPWYRSRFHRFQF